MKKNKIIWFLLCIVFLVGCSIEQSFEKFFKQEMTKKHTGEKNYSYSLIHTELNAVHDGDAIAVFKEQNNQGKQIFIAYFEKENNQWKWKQTRGAEWDSPVKWSSMQQEPYIYSGTLSDKSIDEVFASDEPGKIINVEDGKRFWYVISPIKDAEVTMVKEDGTKEIIEEINHEEL
ncbi:hypothetical protein [Cytobacillus oceanisediminis]|uniref:hypothetical protein n=1 Tax=Cytobacillus oceanisediminis TaxID=665099 RepID=UPI00207A9379|nr:hypothetical protein [Cytobacillus oceanisediminis]USK42245.1 hypothetical protein LIT27_16535 [Cytobacillus oceanisediminis]